MKAQSEGTKQASEPDMAQILLLSDGEFSVTMSNVLRPLMKNEDNMQEQMGKASREMETLR